MDACDTFGASRWLPGIAQRARAVCDSPAVCARIWGCTSA